ncbi:hypothetical protein ACVWXU_000540 [Streptomyces sp. TE33382]
MADAHLALGQPHEAEPLLREAATLATDAKAPLLQSLALARLGTAIHQEGDPDTAMAYFGRALTALLNMDPENEPHRNRLEMDIRCRVGRAHLTAGRRDEAQQQFRAALTLPGAPPHTISNAPRPFTASKHVQPTLQQPLRDADAADPPERGRVPPAMAPATDRGTGPPIRAMLAGRVQASDTGHLLRMRRGPGGHPATARRTPCRVPTRRSARFRAAVPGRGRTRRWSAPGTRGHRGESASRRPGAGGCPGPFRIRPTWELETARSARRPAIRRWDQVDSGYGGVLVAMATIRTRAWGP